jgi:hypothetical protein
VIHYEVGVNGEPLPDDHDPSEPVPLPEWMRMPDLSYKPGWSFRWEGGAFVYLVITVAAPDLKAVDSVTGEERPISWRFQAPYPFNPMWLWERIAGIEYHERGEWLHIDGAKTFDPHDHESIYYPFNRG